MSREMKLAAPATGEYEYACTLPEHWKVMFGTLVVAKGKAPLLQACAQPAPGAGEMSGT